LGGCRRGGTIAAGGELINGRRHAGAFERLTEATSGLD
jgi:hypothetical protein